MKSSSDLIANGKTVVMLGDSITTSGLWWMEFREQWMIRHPGEFCDFRNCGIPGGGVHGALQRYTWDVAPWCPDTVFVMFGMNDVWRDGYAPDADATSFEGKSFALQSYLDGLVTLVDRLESDGVDVVLLTPTPYDEFRVDPGVINLIGVNGALASCAGMVRGLAAAKKISCIDFHTPMTRLCETGDGIIGQDRVHPNELGESVMADILNKDLLGTDRMTVPDGLVKVGRELALVEREQRSLAMLKCWTQRDTGRIDAASVEEWCHRAASQVHNPWVQAVMRRAPELLANEDTMQRDADRLRDILAHFTKTDTVPEILFTNNH